MLRALAWFLLLCGPLAAGPAADLARAIRENTLDRDACYRVRDLMISKEDIRIYLTDGYLIFSKPVAGRPIAAVFTTAVENGDGEVILRPPNLAERRSLASYTQSPNLDVHFQSAYFVFTGDVYNALMAQLPENPTNRKAPDAGALLDEQWTPVLRAISSGYDTRLVLDLMNAPWRKPDFFSAVFRTGNMGDFDVLYDPESPDQVSAGQFVERNSLYYFDVWSHFPSRSARSGKAPPRLHLDLSDYRVEATVEPDLTLDAVTKVKLRVGDTPMQVLPFEIAREMAITEAKVNGTPTEILQREIVRSNVNHAENSVFLLRTAEPLAPGSTYELEFHHSGKIILDTGNRIYYVTARGNWYPSLGATLTNFDLTFRYPKDLELVTPGDVVGDRTEGEWRITRRRPSAPLRFAGFNLGHYEHATASRGVYQVDVCANRTVESNLQPPLVVPVVPPLGRRTGRGLPAIPELPLAGTLINPLARLQRMASEVAQTLEFFGARFGPPPLPHLTVSPIPGNFGQGYPGLIYLSTRSYLNPSDARLARTDELFYDDLLEAHETAHQWWGGKVISASYRDDWLMEALANYSALIYLEKTKGAREKDILLESYRTELLTKRDNGDTVDSAGPIVLGTRLESSLEPRAWRAITYGKGSWILQMLRRRMGDDRFFAMLAEVVKRFSTKEISTEDFRALAAEFLPPKSEDPKLEEFFDQWVYGTGIPTLKLTYSVKGTGSAVKVVGKLMQSDVPEDFSVLTPIEIQVAPGRSITEWVESSNEPVTFTVNLKQAPLKVTLDPQHGVLRR